MAIQIIITFSGGVMGQFLHGCIRRVSFRRIGLSALHLLAWGDRVDLAFHIKGHERDA